MKHFYLFVMTIAAMAILGISCSDIQDETKKQQNEAIGAADFLDAFTSIQIDATLAAEVLGMVNHSIEKGLDENLYLRELWLSEPQVKVSSANGAPLLKSKLEQYFSKLIATKSNDIIDFVKKSNCVIYWPYSENWDGKTLPVITSAPKDEKQEWNYGYRITYNAQGDRHFEQVIVDDDFAYANPVWIIKDGFDYNDLPNFNKGETTKNGLTFVTPNTKAGTNTITCLEA